MHVRERARTIAVPVAAVAAGVSAAGAAVPVAVVVRTSRPGKAVLDQTGAAASPLVQAISASGRHDLAPLANRTVMSRGDSTAGQLGNGTTSARHSAELPVSATGAHQG